MTPYIVMSFFAGGTLGIIAMAVVSASKISKLTNEIAKMHLMAIGDALLRARIRSFQQHGIKQSNGEVKYNLQNAHGRFTSAFLPEV